MKGLIFHCYIAQIMRGWCDNELYIDRCTVREVLGRYRIPYHLHDSFLNEMEDMNLLDIINKNKLRLKGDNQDDWF